MSTGFMVALALVLLLMLLSRLLLPGLPLSRTATRLTALDLVLAAVGLMGLVLHCASMFYRFLVAAIPGTADIISQINSMGTASMIWYIVPSLLLITGLRRQNAVALVVLAVALIAVGVTMYNGTPVPTHVSTIFAAAVIIGAIMFLLVIPPWQNKTLAAQN
ncbi:hypothetical protein [Arthrobacter sp. HLT1-21]